MAVVIERAWALHQRGLQARSQPLSVPLG
jgi:hypothetical protein